MIKENTNSALEDIAAGTQTRVRPLVGAKEQRRRKRKEKIEGVGSKGNGERQRRGDGKEWRNQRRRYEWNGINEEVRRQEGRKI